MTKRTVAFRNFAKVPKKSYFLVYKLQELGRGVKTAEISELSLSAKIASSAFVINRAPLNNRGLARFEVLRAVMKKIQFSCDATPCRPPNSWQCFEGA